MLCTVFSPAYVLQVKVEMELEIQQYEKTKAVREEQLERLTQICQEQAVSDLFCPLRFSLTKITQDDSLARNHFRHWDVPIVFKSVIILKNYKNKAFQIYRLNQTQVLF